MVFRLITTKKLQTGIISTVRISVPCTLLG